MALKFKMGKKAVFFTFVACIFLSLLIFSNSVGNNYNLRQKSFAIETRIHTMNMFVSNVEEDIERGAYIAGFRSLVALVDNVVSTGEYLSDTTGSFNELFFNGTFNGTNSSFLINNTFNDWINKIQIEAEKLNLIVDFSVNNITLFQDDPWKLRVDVDIQILVSDKEDISSWNRKKIVTSYIELDGFEDPFYVMGTNGVVENRIEKTNFTDFVIGTNVDNLMNHTYEGYYISFAGAPSYLMRLEGNFGDSPYGIESLVDLDELLSKGVSIKSKSIVDYIYFSDNTPTAYGVTGAPSWFKLDNSTDGDSQSHHQLYGVSGLV